MKYLVVSMQTLWAAQITAPTHRDALTHYLASRGSQPLNRRYFVIDMNTRRTKEYRLDEPEGYEIVCLGSS